MDGALIIDKPAGITSHDVVARARKILNTKRIGHTGTLDPFATGVLVLLIGKATRLAQFLDKDEKEYEATVRLGFETDTGDLEGIRNAEFGMRNAEGKPKKVSSDEIENVLKEFRGEILQTPPMFSAKKIEGKKLYEFARKGIEVEREPVRVEIFKLEMISDAEIIQPSKQLKVDSSQLKVESDYQDFGIRVVCSAGTYIRTLAQDIGRKLKTGAHLSALRRIRAGKFSIENAITLEELEEVASERKLEGVFVSMNECVSHLPERQLTGEELEDVKHGRRIASQIVPAQPNFTRLTSNSILVAVGYTDENEKSISPKIVFFE